MVREPKTELVLGLFSYVLIFAGCVNLSTYMEAGTQFRLDNALIWGICVILGLCGVGYLRVVKHQQIFPWYGIAAFAVVVVLPVLFPSTLLRIVCLVVVAVMVSMRLFRYRQGNGNR